MFRLFKKPVADIQAKATKDIEISSITSGLLVASKIVAIGTPQVVRIQGTAFNSGEDVIGGWAEVHNCTRSTYASVSVKDFAMERVTVESLRLSAIQKAVEELQLTNSADVLAYCRTMKNRPVEVR